MLNTRQLPIRLSAMQIREVSRSDSGPLLLVRAKFEAELADAKLVPFASAAVAGALAESRSRAEEEGPNSYKIRAKIDLPTGLYTLRLLGGDSDERFESLVAEAAAAIEDTKDREELVRKLRAAVAGKARTVRFSGSTVGSPDANVVEGVLSLVWQVEARIDPDAVASLATMLHSENVLLDCVSEQATLDLDDFGDGDPDDPEEKKRGKGGAPKPPRSARSRGAAASAAGVLQ
jgi:hypothetical protein